MNRFLKKEWDNTEAPESLLRAVRDRAWSRVHSPPRTAGVRWVWAAAVAAAVLFAVVVSQRQTAPTASLPTLPIADRSFTPLTPVSPELAPSVDPPSAPAPEPVQRAAPVARVRRQTVAAPLPNDAPARTEEILPTLQQTQLVSTFHLAETGVRMIWVQDVNFFKEGDAP